MNNLRIERVNYFTGEALLTADFQCEQEYMRETGAIGRSSLYTYGIAHGLDVSMPASNAALTLAQVEVSPGVAIDSLGRQIILTQRCVLPLREVENGATYFITINYHEVYADYSDETGSAGYKRVIEQPELRCLRNLDQPGLYILLAVVSFASDGKVNALTYKSGNMQRRYVATSVGAVNFITEGAGVGSALENAEMLGANLLTRYAVIKAKREGKDSSYLEFDAARGHFTGLLTSRGNLGVGVEAPQANLQVDAITFKGAGTISSIGTQVTFNGSVPNPFLLKGDILTADASVTGGAAQSKTVTAIITPGKVVQVDSAFKSNLTDTPYSYVRSTLARFSATAGVDTCLLQISVDGSVGLGMQASVNSGTTPGPNALVITKDRKVGIALNSGEPQVTLDVNGPVSATALTTSGPITTTDINASGAIKALSFEGNGSKLQGMAKLSYWTREAPTADLSNLYYDTGNVGIMMRNPPASLSVGGGAAFIGNGVITSLTNLKLVGYQTRFLDQVKPGYILAIGTLNNQTSVVVGKPTNDTNLNMNSQFGIPAVNSAYSFQAPNGSVTPGKGTVSSNGTQLIGTGTSFTEFDDGYSIIIPRFTATSTLEQSQTVATDPISNTELTLVAAYIGEVKDLPYSYTDPKTGIKKLGTGTISANGPKVTGVGTNFLSDIAGNSKLYTNPVQENSSMPLRWTVASVEDQTNLTLNVNGDIHTADFTAATSAYMVSSGLLGQFEANNQNGILPPENEDALPPALLVLTNSSVEAPNTVAINVQYQDVLRNYALQVDGDVNFSGGNVNMDNLTVKTLYASQSVTAGGTMRADNALLTVQNTQNGKDVPTLAVTAGVVQIGTNTTSAALNVSGGIGAGADIVSATQVQGKSLNSTGNITAGGNISTATGNVQAAKLVATNLNVTGLNISGASGAVQFFGAPQGYNQLPISQTAETDGFVMAVVGSSSFQNDQTFIGTLLGVVYSSGQPICTMYATTFNAAVVINTSKDGDKKTSVSIPGTLTMPVSKGNIWSLSLIGVSGTAPIQVTYYWIPLGTGQPPSFSTVTQTPSTEPALLAAPDAEASNNPDALSMSALPASEVTARALVEPDEVSEAAPEPVFAADSISAPPTTQAETPENAPSEAVKPNQAAQDLYQRLLDYDNYLRSGRGRSVGDALQTIESRVQDLTDIFGNATRMGNNPEHREKFVQDLKKIVCFPNTDGQVQAQKLEDKNIQELIDTFSKASERSFTAEEQALLANGIKALVQINDNEANRNDLSLIKQNIDLFLDNVQKALPTTFSNGDKRLLTRALVRLVGDGSQGDAPPALTVAAHDSTTAPATANEPEMAAGTTAAASNAAAEAAPATTSIAEQMRRLLENSLGGALKNVAVPALEQLVDAALQGGSAKYAGSELLQKVEQMLPYALSVNGKQILQSKLNQLLAQHAHSGFLGDIEQALNIKLADSDKQGLQNIIDGLIGGKTSKEDAGKQLWSGIENVAKGALEEKAKGLLGAAIEKLLCALI